MNKETISGNPFLRALNLLDRSKADYVIVGGFAVVMHGCNRFTPDMNVMVRHDEGQLRVLADLFLSNNFVATTEEKPEKLFSSNGREELYAGGKRWFYSFRDMEEPSFSIDVFLRFPVPFPQVYGRRMQLPYSAGDFSICSLEDLIAMKSIAGRGQDKSDIGALSLIKSIEERKASGLSENAIIEMSTSDAEAEQAEGILKFAHLSPDEKLEWLQQMLSYLGKFCVA
jgi:hypothetical protein